MNIELIEGETQRLSDIVMLNYQIFKGMYDWEPYSVEEYQKRLSNTKPIFFLASQEEQLMGDAIIFEKNNSLYLWILGVDASARKKGVASALFEAIETYAREKKYSHITMKVYNVSTDMLRLTLKRGFHIVAVDPSDKNSKYHAVHLERDL